MSFLDKVKFWKKDDFDVDLGLGDDFSKDPFGSDSGKSDPLGSSPDPFGSNPSPDPFGSSPSGSQSNSPDSFGSQDAFSQQQAPPPPGMGGPNNFASAPSQPQFAPPQQAPPPQSSSESFNSYGLSKEMEIISSKLDALRASLDTINQRISNLERIAEGDSSRNRYRW